MQLKHNSTALLLWFRGGVARNKLDTAAVARCTRRVGAFHCLIYLSITGA